MSDPAIPLSPASARDDCPLGTRQFFKPGPPDVWLMTREALEQRVEP
jgi:hypothetical protein